MKDSNRELALAALTDAIDEHSVGEFLDEKETEKGVFEVRFENKVKGYANWFWVVTITQPDKRKPALVSEVNLLAGPDALLAPAWVPWAERLAEFKRQLRAEGKAATDAEADAMIANMALALADNVESQESKQDANDGSVKPPTKARVRQRRIKRADENQDQEPDSESE